jgi:hypothetical protein
MTGARRVLAATAPAALCRLNLTGRGVKSWNGASLDALWLAVCLAIWLAGVKSWNGARRDARQGKR